MTDRPNHDDLTEQERAALEAAKLGITSASYRETANDLAAMAADPDIQREYTAIAYEFKNTEMDGLTDEPQPETVEINGQPVPVLDWRGGVPVVPGNMVTEPQPEAGGDECSMCGGVGELEATLVDGTRESVACPACLQKQFEEQLASQQRELDDLRKALEEIHTLTLDLTVQSRLSAAGPGAKISNICLHALGLITDEEFEALKGE